MIFSPPQLPASIRLYRLVIVTTENIIWFTPLQVIRTFGSLQITDKRVLRLLKEKEKGDGLLASEAKRVLGILDSAAVVAASA